MGAWIIWGPCFGPETLRIIEGYYRVQKMGNWRNVECVELISDVWRAIYFEENRPP